MNSTGLNVQIVPGLVDIILNVLQVDHFPMQINILGDVLISYTLLCRTSFLYTEGTGTSDIVVN